MSQAAMIVSLLLLAVWLGADAATTAGGAAAAGPWEKYIYAPATRTVLPVRTYTPPPPSPPQPSSACGSLAGTVNEWGPHAGSPPVPQMNLSCAPGSGTITKVDFAAYGTPTVIDVCSFSHSSSCDSKTVQAWVEKECLGQVELCVAAGYDHS